TESDARHSTTRRLVRRPSRRPLRPRRSRDDGLLCSYSFHIHHENPVADACRILASRRLEGDALPVRADDRIRGFVASVFAPVRDAREVLAVWFELQLPDVDVVRILLELLTTRFHKRVLSIGENTLHLVVFAGELTIDGNLTSRQLDAEHIGKRGPVAGIN